MPDSKIEVAVLGGGIGGASIMMALRKWAPNVVANVYEARPSFEERGAGVGLGINARNALGRISGFKEEAGQGGVLDEANAVRGKNSSVRLATKDKFGEVIRESLKDKPPYTMHRASLLKALLKDTKAENMHVNKAAKSITQQQDGRVQVQFEDGTSVTVDLVIGSDGVSGKSRAYVCGADHPAATPNFSGLWDMRNLVPIEVANEKLGDLIDVETPRQVMWRGDDGERGGCMMMDFAENGTLFQVVLTNATEESWARNEPYKTVTRDAIEKEFGTILYKIGLPAVELMCMQAEPYRRFPQWEHSPAPSYVRGHVVMMGDAAHTMTPWCGSGAAMAIEDALVLSTVLGRVRKASDIEAALTAYDAVRRPRTQRVVQYSKKSGLLTTGRDPSLRPDDYEGLRKEYEHLWDEIIYLDFDKHLQEATNAMDAALKT